MATYLVKRLLLLIPVLLGVSLVVLLLIEITPGDPARMILGAQASEEQVLELHHEMGLDDPIAVRYARFLWGVLHGDLGKSYTTHRPVFEEIAQRLPYTFQLVSFSVALAILLGIPFGVYAATHQYTWKDNLAMFIALFCVSMPNFWFALLLIRRFGVTWRWLPISGVGTWQGWVLPCVSFALGMSAVIARQTRSNMLEVIRQDYINTARVKGVSEAKVKYRHALKNAIIPVVMTIGGIYGSMLGGAMIAEIIFSIPGLGSYTFSGLSSRDYPVIQGSVLVLSILFAIVILIVDILFALIDPRIRSQYSKIKTRAKKKKKQLISEGVGQ